MKKNIEIAVVLLLSCIFSATAYSEYKPKVGEKREPRIPLVEITQGYEADSIQLNRGLDGKIHSAETKACPSCPIDKFQLTPSTKVYIRSKQISIDSLDMMELNGKGGAVSYYPETKALHHILFLD